MGDGVLIEFRSVVDAVRCAIEVQNGMAERNAGLPPDRRIDFRVGIHVGDVVEESDGDLMGDGVNIAARLEGIAKPGGICLSEDAYRQVKARPDLAVSDLGNVQLKNIADPVHVYSIEVCKPATAKSILKPVGRNALPLFAWRHHRSARLCGCWNFVPLVWTNEQSRSERACASLHRRSTVFKFEWRPK